MNASTIFKKSKDIIWTMSDGKLNLTLLDPECNEIFSFSGKVALILNDFLARNEFNLNVYAVEKFLGEKVEADELCLLKDFCLEKKIIVAA